MNRQRQYESTRSLIYVSDLQVSRERLPRLTGTDGFDLLPFSWFFESLYTYSRHTISSNIIKLKKPPYLISSIVDLYIDSPAGEAMRTNMIQDAVHNVHNVRPWRVKRGIVTCSNVKPMLCLAQSLQQPGCLSCYIMDARAQQPRNCFPSGTRLRLEN